MQLSFNALPKLSPIRVASRSSRKWPPRPMNCRAGVSSNVFLWRRPLSLTTSKNWLMRACLKSDQKGSFAIAAPGPMFWSNTSRSCGGDRESAKKPLNQSARSADLTFDISMYINIYQYLLGRCIYDEQTRQGFESGRIRRSCASVG